MNLENDVLQLKGIVSPGRDLILRPSFSYVRNLRQANSGGNPRSLLPDAIVTDILLQSYSARLDAEHGLIGGVSGRAGVEYTLQDQDSEGASPLVPDAKVTNFAAFAYEETRFGDFGVSAGLRIDTRSQEAEANETLELPDEHEGETADVLEQSYTEFTGSLGGTWRLSEYGALAANVARGFRAPSIFELHAYGEHGGVQAVQIGDPNLEPETSLSTDLSARWRSPRLQAKVTVYRNAIDNYIYLYNTGEIYEGEEEHHEHHEHEEHAEKLAHGGPGVGLPIMAAQQGDAVLLGADLSAQAQVLPWLQLLGSFETVTGENSDTDEDLPLLPATSLRGEVRFTQSTLWRFERVYAGLGVRHSLAKDAAGRYEPFWQFDANPSFGVASTDAYTLMDLSLGGEFPFGASAIAIDFSVTNLLNSAYRDFLDTYKGYALSPGRDAQLTVTIPFAVGR